MYGQAPGMSTAKTSLTIQRAAEGFRRAALIREELPGAFGVGRLFAL